MRDSGFVKIHRQILASAIASEPAVAWTFITILLSVNWKRGWFKMDTPVEPGQMVYSCNRLAERLYGDPKPDWKIPSKNAVIRHLKKLESAGMVRLESFPNSHTILTVVNWKKYQSDVDDSQDPTVPKTGTPTGTPTGTDRRRDKKEKKSGDRKRFTPPSVEDVKEYSKTLDSTPYPNAPPCVQDFHNHYSANGWRQGKGPLIKDWKAAFRSWVRRQQKFASIGQQSTDDTRHYPQPKPRQRAVK